jgi:hydroxymethylpyrimidine/phosphomethylpyrimidine kinase
MSDQVPVCLTIGSSDSGGGAGVQGDIKAYASVGCFATTVVVGITAQNTAGITGRWTVPVPAVLAQLDAVRTGFPVRAAKIGTTWSEELLLAVAGPLRELALDGVPVVVDPVMVTTAGSWLSDLGRTRALVAETLFPVATVITPNRREAELLAGVEPGGSSRRALAEKLAGLGAAAVIVTGGPREQGDWFFDGVEHHHIQGTHYDNGAEHGAGCAHSALVAGLLAQGLTLATAVSEAHHRAAESVRNGHVHLGDGPHPVDVLGIGAETGAFGGPGLRFPLSWARPLDVPR